MGAPLHGPMPARHFVKLITAPAAVWPSRGGMAKWRAHDTELLLEFIIDMQEAEDMARWECDAWNARHAARRVRCGG